MISFHVHRLSDRAAGRVHPREPETCLVCLILDIRHPAAGLPPSAPIQGRTVMTVTTNPPPVADPAAQLRARLELARSTDAVLNRPSTTTPSFADARPTGAVPGLRPNPGMLRALMQPVLFLTLLEPVGAYEVGDVVAAQFWGEGRVMLTPLPLEATRGRIPTTFPANQIHAEIAQPRHPAVPTEPEAVDVDDLPDDPTYDPAATALATSLSPRANRAL